MHLKTTALLGNIARQNVSKQLLPLSNSKNSVLTLSQRTTQPVGANTPANPVRSFSSSQASNNNNNNNGPNGSPLVHGSSTFSSNRGANNTQRFKSSIASSLNFQQQPSSAGKQPQQPSQQHSREPNLLVPRGSAQAKDALASIQGQDGRNLFPLIQEMLQRGQYADSSLTSEIVGQLLVQNSPKDAEKALSMLMDCHRNLGRNLSANHKITYTTLAKDIVNYSNDFAQSISLARLLQRHRLLATSGFADGTLRSYRQLKSTSGLAGIKETIGSADVEMLLTLQASMEKTSSRYKQLIEILLDSKEMDIVPSQVICSEVSVSFTRLGDYAGQLAWDTAVQEIYPGFTPNIPQHAQTSNRGDQPSNDQRRRAKNSNAQVVLRKGDPSEAIIRACRSGYVAVALEELTRMTKLHLVPAPQAIAEIIYACSKREKKVPGNYQELFQIAERSLSAIKDKTHRRAAEYEVFNSMLIANATIGDMASAKKNYDDIVKLGQFPDASGYAALLLATTTGAVDEALDALKILEEVKRHNIKPNIFFYNVVIGKLSRGRKIERVLEVYEDMITQRIRPNVITYGTLISACTRVGNEDMARNLFTEMVGLPGYHPRQGPHNAMIQFYVRQKKNRATALEYYDDMLQRGLLPTEHTYTILIEAFACIKPYDMAEANRLLRSMKKGPVRADEPQFGALIHAYGVEHGDVATAERVFQDMLAEGITPRGPAYQALIEGYITNGNLRRAIELRDELQSKGQPSNTYIENTMIRGFGLARDIKSAETVFRSMMDPYSAKTPGVIVKEPSSYHSMVSAYLENGMLDEALATLANMKSQQYPELVVRPVEETIQAALPSSTPPGSHAGNNAGLKVASL